MACMLPSAVLTAEEQACCKEMANQCGRDRMPPSHPCCRTITPSDQNALAKSSFNLIYQTQLLYFAEPIVQVADLPKHISDVYAVLGHSPPEGPSASLDILRI